MVANCTMKSPRRSRASRTLMLRLARIATANADCAAVTNSSSRCSASSGRPWCDFDEIANTIGKVPTSSVHWFTFDDTSAPRPALVLSRHANMPAISSSGASEARGASHFTSRNVLTPNSSPVDTSDSANGSAQSRMTAAAPTNITPTAIRRSRTGRVATNSAVPTRCGSSAGRPRDAHEVGDEDRNEHDRVEERDRPLQRQREAVEGRAHQERDLDRVAPGEHHVGRRPPETGVDHGLERRVGTLLPGGLLDPVCREEHDE